MDVKATLKQIGNAAKAAAAELGFATCLLYTSPSPRD